MAIATLLVVTGVAVGLGAETTTFGSNVDYWLVPEGGAGSVLVSTGGPMLGETHETSASLRDRDDIEYATPVLSRPIELESATEREYVLAVGVVGSPGAPRVAGLPPDTLSPDDPRYAQGRYDGPWTGEVVASSAAATILDVDDGDAVGMPAVNESGTVVGVHESEKVTADIPIVLVQLSELQTMTGADDRDQADQLLVASSSGGIKSDLAAVYPQTTVETRSGLLAQNVIDEDIGLALSLTGLLAALGIGTLFVSTTMGMEVVASRDELATMSAVGLRTSSRLVIVGVEVLVTTLLGGVLGIVLGAGGIVVANEGATRLLDVTVATFHPAFLGYGVVVALLIGRCSLPYLGVLVSRVGTAGGISQ
jgi:putative ABC transport system permease protein